MAEGSEGGWNPWRALRGRPHVVLEWGELTGTRGALVEAPDGRVIWLDWRLGRRARSAVLTHELVHDERGLLYDETTPVALVAKEEAAVRTETARRLVPPRDLAAMIAEGEPVELWQIAERFDTTEEVARAAVERWFGRQG
jgi:hypothetical protein